MLRKLSKSDKSLTVIIPASIVKELNLKLGEYLDVRLKDNHIEAIPVKVIEKK